MFYTEVKSWISGLQTELRQPASPIISTYLRGSLLNAKQQKTPLPRASKLMQPNNTEIGYITWNKEAVAMRWVNI